MLSPYLRTQLRGLSWGLVAVASLHAFVEHVGHPAPCAGPSMLPTLEVEGDAVWVDARCRRGRGVRVGDVVSARHPADPREAISKRVLGLPGDFVLRDTPNSATSFMIQVPDGHCWLAGDNLPWSRDSRDYGPVPLALIRGRVAARVWPPRRAKWIGSTLEEAEG
jgi:inner membrane protease subunit 1